MTQIIITFLVGAAGGLTGYVLRLPAGVLVGSMLAVGAYNCLGFKAYMPAKLRIGGRIIVGCLLGLNINPAAIMELKNVIVPALIIVFMLLCSGCLTSFIVHRYCKLDLNTAFLSSSAGGLTDLSMLATSLGEDGPKVAVIHLVRVMTVMTTMPLILILLEKIMLK